MAARPTAQAAAADRPLQENHGRTAPALSADPEPQRPPALDAQAVNARQRTAYARQHQPTAATLRQTPAAGGSLAAVARAAAGDTGRIRTLGGSANNTPPPRPAFSLPRVTTQPASEVPQASLHLAAAQTTLGQPWQGQHTLLQQGQQHVPRHGHQTWQGPPPAQVCQQGPPWQQQPSRRGSLLMNSRCCLGSQRRCKVFSTHHGRGGRPCCSRPISPCCGRLRALSLSLIQPLLRSHLGRCGRGAGSPKVHRRPYSWVRRQLAPYHRARSKTFRPSNIHPGAWLAWMIRLPNIQLTMEAHSRWLRCASEGVSAQIFVEFCFGNAWVLPYCVRPCAQT